VEIEILDSIRFALFNPDRFHGFLLIVSFQEENAFLIVLKLPTN